MTINAQKMAVASKTLLKVVTGALNFEQILYLKITKATKFTLLSKAAKTQLCHDH